MQVQECLASARVPAFVPGNPDTLCGQVCADQTDQVAQIATRGSLSRARDERKNTLSLKHGHP